MQIVEIFLIIWELLGLIFIFVSARYRDEEGILIQKYPSSTQWGMFLTWWSLPLMAYAWYNFGGLF